MTVTQINAGKQHNVVPSECDLVIDIRVNDCYSNPEILEVVKEHVDAEVTPLHALECISIQSVLRACKSLGGRRYLVALQMNLLQEIEEGIQLYKKLQMIF
jgi:hypothetical protein